MVEKSGQRRSKDERKENEDGISEVKKESGRKVKGTKRRKKKGKRKKTEVRWLGAYLIGTVPLILQFVEKSPKFHKDRKYVTLKSQKECCRSLCYHS